MMTCRSRLTIAALAACLTWTGTARADEWNDRTVLTFSEPVMIPGVTLQAGTYVFKLADSSSARHLVQVFTDDEQKMVTAAQAVPTKRAEPKADVVLKFNPTDRGTPPALKAWFYPGSLYGHEFVYTEAQARDIAQRSKTVVLSTDVAGTDLERGSLRTIDPAGAHADWHADEATMREWSAWQRTRRPRADSNAGRASATPMIEGDFQGQRVKLDDLEENPSKYAGQTISVDAEVEEVFGPRMFTIDEPNWGDLDGEILVYVPTVLAALVRDDDRLTITGTLKPFVRAEFEREWGWLGLNPEVEVELKKKPVLVASRIVGGNNNVVLMISADSAQETPVGTSGKTDASRAATDPTTGSGGAPALTQLQELAKGDEDLVGRRVNLTQVRVEGAPRSGGFFARGAEGAIFILSPEGTSVRDGETVTIAGVVLQMPRTMEERLNPPSGANDDIYIAASSVTKQSGQQ